MNRLWKTFVWWAPVALLTACEKSATSTSQGMPAPQVGVITVATEPLKMTTTLAGRTSASLEAEVRPQVSGILLQRFFNEGAKVTKGQPLYQIDPAPYQASLDSAKASLANAQASLKSARALAERYQDLVQSQAVSKQDYDDAAAQYQQAIAAVDTAKAAVTSAQINLEYTKVIAPISGRAGKSNFTVGALVTANQSTALVNVQQFDPMFVDVTESTAQLSRLRRAWDSGQLVRSKEDNAQVRLLFDDGSQYEPQGTFEFADINVNPTTSSFTIRTVFPNPKDILLPGMFVRAELVTGTRAEAILVPAKGVSRNAAGAASVLLVNAKNEVIQQPIQVDGMVNGQWLVTDGLSAGDKVIVEGLQFVRPGMPVGGVHNVDK